MQNCWHETPTKRPTFKELKPTLECLMSQQIPHITLSIGKNQDYCYTPSMKSISESDENYDDDGIGGGCDDDGETYQNGGDNDDRSAKIVGTLPNTPELQ